MADGLGFAAGGRDRAAGDRDAAAVAVFAAADARAFSAAGRDRAAGDRDDAAVAVFAADARAEEAAGGRDRAACDRDAATAAAGAAADACAEEAAGGRDRAACDRDGAAVAVFAAADARIIVAGSRERAAVDRDEAAVAFIATADASAAVADGRDAAAVDRDEAAVTINAAADARTVVADGRDESAVDRDAAGGLFIVSANGGILFVTGSVVIALRVRRAVRSGKELAHPVTAALRPEGEGIALAHVDAQGGGQRRAVAENEVHLARDGDAGVDRRALAQHVPAVREGGLIVQHGIDRAALFGLVRVRGIEVGHGREHGDVFLVLPAVAGDGDCARRVLTREDGQAVGGEGANVRERLRVALGDEAAAGDGDGRRARIVAFDAVAVSVCVSAQGGQRSAVNCEALSACLNAKAVKPDRLSAHSGQRTAVKGEIAVYFNSLAVILRRAAHGSHVRAVDHEIRIRDSDTGAEAAGRRRAVFHRAALGAQGAAVLTVNRGSGAIFEKDGCAGIAVFHARLRQAVFADERKGKFLTVLRIAEY